jgi:hypothetical protein
MLNSNNDNLQSKEMFNMSLFKGLRYIAGGVLTIAGAPVAAATAAETATASVGAGLVANGIKEIVS